MVFVTQLALNEKLKKKKNPRKQKTYKRMLKAACKYMIIMWLRPRG